MYKIKLAPYTMEISFTNNLITESDVIWFVAMIIGFKLINLFCHGGFAIRSF